LCCSVRWHLFRRFQWLFLFLCCWLFRYSLSNQHQRMCFQSLSQWSDLRRSG
jgi:hypothetical protein